MGRIGMGELLLILLVALLIFGPSKLSDLGKGLGESLKNFKKGLSDLDGDAPPPAPPPPPAASTDPATLNPTSATSTNEPAGSTEADKAKSSAS